VRSLYAELIEHRRDIPGPKVHRIRLPIVRLVAATEPALIDVDESELATGQCLGELGLADVRD
jgi:hypothetical protein